MAMVDGIGSPLTIAISHERSGIDRDLSDIINP
jgi:hypothetical protein